MTIRKSFHRSVNPTRSELQEVESLSDKVLFAALANKTCQSWFINRMFFRHYTYTDDQYRAILNHENCSDAVFACLLAYRSDLVKRTEAYRRYMKNKRSNKEAFRDTQEVVDIFQEFNFINLVYFPDDYRDQCRLSGFDAELLLSQIPPFVMEYFLDKSDQNEGIAAFIICFCSNEPVVPNQYVESYAKHKDIFYRKAAAKYSRDPSAAYMLDLAVDSSVAVRKVVAKREDLTPEQLEILLNDSATSVKDVIAKNQSIPAADRTKFKKIPHSSVSDQEHNNGDAVEMLSLPELSCENLLLLARHSQAAIRCASAIHDSASEDIFNEVVKGKEVWTWVPVARKTRNPILIEKLLGSGDLAIIEALCANDSITVKQALAILKKYPKKPGFKELIAANKADEETVINAVIGDKTSRFEKQLSLAVNSTDKAKLKDMFDDPHHLAISRALARNPNISKRMASVFAEYLPGDIAANPLFSLDILSGGGPKGVEVGNWNLNYSLNEQSNTSQFLINRHCTRDDLARLRVSVHNTLLDRYKLYEYVLLNDLALAKRLLKGRTTGRLGERVVVPSFCYEYFAISPRVQVRKMLAESKKAPLSVIRVLTKDEDSSVRNAASSSLASRGKKAA